MNYRRTSMNWLNILPPRVRQHIYDFDGRYKIAKGECLKIIKEMGLAAAKKKDVIGSLARSRSDMTVETYHSCWPLYYAEIQRRVAKYRGLLKDGHILGVTTHLKRAPKSYYFKDALGSYYLGTDYDTIFINNTAYKSTKKVFTVVMEPLYRGDYGTQTVVKRIDILDPVYIKSIKLKGKKREQLFRELGVSENGIPGRDLYYEAITIDGKNYFLENKHFTRGGLILKTRSGGALGQMNSQGVIKWYGDKR